MVQYWFSSEPGKQALDLPGLRILLRIPSCDCRAPGSPGSRPRLWGPGGVCIPAPAPHQVLSLP